VNFECKDITHEKIHMNFLNNFTVCSS